MPGNATVTVAHMPENLAELTRQADIVVMALGIPEYLTADMVKKGLLLSMWELPVYQTKSP